MSNSRPTKETKAGNNTFMYIHEGEFRQSVKEEDATKETVSRVTSKGKKVFENRYDKLTGKIVGIGISERDLPNGKKEKELEVKLKDEYGIVFIKMSLQGKFANEFIKKLVNVDLMSEVEIYPSYFKETNKSFFTIKQNGEKLTSYFTKENQNGLPQPIVTEKTNGEKIWDFGYQTMFFEELIERIFKINVYNIVNGKDLMIDAKKEIAIIAKEFAAKAKEAAKTKTA